MLSPHVPIGQSLMIVIPFIQNLFGLNVPLCFNSSIRYSNIILNSNTIYLIGTYILYTFTCNIICLLISANVVIFLRIEMCFIINVTY